MYNVVDSGFKEHQVKPDNQLLEYYRRMIFNELFTCSVPDLLTRTDEHLRAWGVAVTGDKHVDASAASNRVQPLVTIETIRYWFECGIDVEFINHEDIPVIYGYVGGFLEEWAKVGSRGVNYHQDSEVEWVSALMDFFRELYRIVPESTVREEDTTPTVNLGLIPVMQQIRNRQDNADYSKNSFRDRYRSIEESIDRRTRR